MATATIELPESADVLRRAALAGQPVRRTGSADQGDHPCLVSAATSDEALRLQAVDGLESLARAGVPSAIDALHACATDGSLAVRALSLAALGDIEGAGERRADAAARLAPDVRYLAELQRVDVRSVTQIADPHVHLRDADRDDRPPPDIDGHEPWPVSRRSTPRAGGGDHHG